MTYAAPAATDGYGRRFRYLRLSVTDVCNFRCTYCLPNGWKRDGPLDFLSAREIEHLVRAFAGMGLAKVRLTGGEPSVRKDFTQIIARVASIQTVSKVATTTNGWNLSKRIDDWVEAGLTHLNISIDALDRATFHHITGHDRLPSVIEGLDKALAHPLKAVKVNAVLLRDSLEGGFRSWTDFIKDRPIAVRFIELMRTGDNADFFADQHVGGGALRDWLDQNGWVQRGRDVDDGPAVEYVHPDFRGRIGLIAPYAPGFCDSCNRLRVTARGQLRLCLFGTGGLDLRDLLQSGDDLEALQARIQSSLLGKRASHRLLDANPGTTLNLAQTGG